MDENLQYTLTFKTRAETAPVEQVVQKVRDLRMERERLDAMQTAPKAKVAETAYYDLSRAIEQSAASTRKETVAVEASDVQRAQAMQTVRKIREELQLSERMQQRVTAANERAGGGFKAMGGQAAMAAFQIQDMAVQLQAGVDVATVMAQQLPQLLMVLGPQGAIAGGAIAVGALVMKLVTAQHDTKVWDETLKELNQRITDLRQSGADQFVQAFSLALQTAEDRTRALNEAEVERLGTQAQIESAQRRVVQSQEDMLKSYLKYQATVNGVDVTAAEQALEQRKIQREGEEAIAAQTTKVDQQRKAYENLLQTIRDMKASMSDLETERQGLDTQASDLQKQLALANATGKQGAATDLEQRLANVLAKAEEMDRMLAEMPGKIEAMQTQAVGMATKLQDTIDSTKANIEAINQDVATKASKADIDAALQQNRDATNSLSSAVAGFKEATPVQQAAIDKINEALKDGAISQQEALQVAAAIQTLLSTLTSTNESNRGLLNKVLTVVQKVQADNAALEQKVEGMLNRQ